MHLAMLTSPAPCRHVGCRPLYCALLVFMVDISMRGGADMKRKKVRRQYRPWTMLVCASDYVDERKMSRERGRSGCPWERKKEWHWTGHKVAPPLVPLYPHSHMVLSVRPIPSCPHMDGRWTDMLVTRPVVIVSSTHRHIPSRRARQ